MPDLLERPELWTNTVYVPFGPQILSVKNMWFEILPSIGIITVATTISPIAAYFGFKFLQNGNAYKRDLRTNPFDLGLFRRDNYLTGTPYVVKGLENIPDE